MTWSEAELSAFIDESWNEMEVVQDLLERNHGLLSRAWNLDQTKGIILLTAKDKSTLVFDVSAVGSISNGSWMWAWANQSILTSLSQESLELKGLAKVTGLRFFNDPVWDDVNDEDGWRASAIALKVLGGLGIYRCPISPEDSLFLLLRERFNA